MQSQVDDEDNPCLFLPRPWLQADPRNVREVGHKQVYSCGEHMLVQGRVGQTLLPYWHRAVAMPAALAVKRTARRMIVTPM